MVHTKYWSEYQDGYKEKEIDMEINIEMERKKYRWRERNWDEEKKFKMERKKLRWAKMGKVEGFIKPVETQMASSLQGLEKGQDFTFYVFPFILHPCRGWWVKFYILCFSLYITSLQRHTWYLSFFLHGQNFSRIKFTPTNANFLR